VRSFAQAMFYTMKSMEVRIAKLEKMVAESGNAQAGEQAVNLRSQHKTLDDNYNHLLTSLKVYDPKMTEEQTLVLRVARIFGQCELDMPKDFFAEVQKYIQLWKARGRYLEYVRRAQQKGYAGRISREFTSQGLPRQFFYLAMMESGFNEHAVGPMTSMGYAKGMWQFIPKTATEYGLKLGPLVASQRVDPLDDRHHWDRETKAAAAYIKNLYGTEGQASGFLVMACYNSVSQHSVLRVVKGMHNNPRDRNFWKLLELYRAKMPYETYAYVLFIVSAAVIGENPRLFGSIAITL